MAKLQLITDPGSWLCTDDFQRTFPIDNNTRFFVLDTVAFPEDNSMWSFLHDVTVPIDDLETCKKYLDGYYASWDQFVNYYPDRADQIQLLAEIIAETWSAESTADESEFSSTNDDYNDFDGKFAEFVQQEPWKALI